MTGEDAVFRDEGFRSYLDLVSAWLFRNLPLVAYGSVYILTCLIGAVLILERVEPFYSLYVYYSGTQAPTYDNSGKVAATWALLIVAPLLVGLGYLCAGWLVRRFGAATALSRTAADDDSRGLLVLALFWSASIAGGYGIWRAYCPSRICGRGSTTTCLYRRGGGCSMRFRSLRGSISTSSFRFVRRGCY